MRILSLATLAIGLGTSFAMAAKNAELKPVLPIPGAVGYESAFDSGTLEKPWSKPKGEWVIREGAIAGKELAADKHAAVLSLDMPNRDSAVQFSFKMDGSKGFAVSLNYAKGHLFRVSVAPNGITVNKDKDKKDPASKTEVLSKADGQFKAGEWYTMLVEIQGDKVVVQTDNGVKAEASHAALNVDKSNYRFVLRGETLLLDDLKIWKAAQ